MTDEPDDRAEKQRRMKALSDDERRDAIDSADNVVGFDRFQDRSKQVALREVYRKPQTPAPGGKA